MATNSSSPGTENNYGAHLERIKDLDVAKWIELSSNKLSPQRLREKRWCYFGVINPEIIIGSAIVHLGYATNAFVFVYDRKEDQLIEKGFTLPPMGQIQFDRTPDSGTCSLDTPDASIDMIHNCASGKRTLNIDLTSNKGKAIKANIEVEEGFDSKPLQLLTPMENGKKVFTQKIAGLKANGNIEVAEKKFDLDPENSFAIFDWTDGFHNRETTWNWASAGGLSQCSKRIGINFSAGVYTSGINENVIWIDGKPTSQTDISFSYDKNETLNTWHIKDQNGLVDLSFQPVGRRRARDDFKVVASNFTQAFGNFSGFISDQNGDKIEITDLGGVVEEHFARW